jgi:hypothetical protein
MASLIIFVGLAVGIVVGVANFLTSRGPWLLTLMLLGCSGPEFQGSPELEPEPEPESERPELRPRPPLDRADPRSPLQEERDPKLTATFTVSDEYTDEQIEIISEVLDSWHRATDGAVDLEMVIGPVDGQPFSIGPMDLDGPVAGRAVPPELDRIETDRWLERGPSLFRVVVAHELGHYLGLLHVKDPTALMFAGNYQVSEPQPIDIAQFWERH